MRRHIEFDRLHNFRDIGGYRTVDGRRVRWGRVGVSEEDIVADFALTGPATRRILESWRARNGGRAPIWPGYGQTPPGLMRTFLAELARRHGPVRGYAVTRLGVDEDLIGALRGHLLGA